MRASLTVGLDTAKGLAVAWQVPLLGVNHMQAHALTPRLVSSHSSAYAEPTPAFPYLSLLVSGGHTMLVHSKALCEHPILTNTTDGAIGDYIDKSARLVLPPTVLDPTEIMYGRQLERFAFPNGASDYHYSPPLTRVQEIMRKKKKWGWSLPLPLAETRSMQYSFSGVGSAVQRICESMPDMQDEERIELAKEVMRVAFEHLAVRVVMALQDLKNRRQCIKTLVVSGGVASNGYLRTV